MMKALFPIAIALWFVLRSCNGSIQRTQLSLGFRGSEMEYIDNSGLFLLSNSSTFAFGFSTYGSNDTTSFLLSVVHQGSGDTVWTANRGSPVGNSDAFAFGADGNAYLSSGSDVIWSTNTSSKGAARMELFDNGNLVILGSGGDAEPLWQSFDYPTDTLLSGQRITEGMSLVSSPNGHGLSFRLGIESGDAKLVAEFPSVQPYWSMEGDARKIVNKVGGGIRSAVLDSSSWNFYDENRSLIWQFLVNDAGANSNDTLAAVLDPLGFISFSVLPSSDRSSSLPTRIPEDPCDTPEPCNPYFICGGGSSSSSCQCPTVLSSASGCNPDIASPCDPSSSLELAKVDDGVGYFATGFISPSANTNLTGCKDACLRNCSCAALFHDESSGNCFLFDQIGSLKRIDSNTASYTCYIKLKSEGDGGQGSTGGGSSLAKTLIIVAVISVFTVAVIAALIYFAFRLHRKKKAPEPSQGSSDEDTFLESISGMPVRFSYKDLQVATDNFSVKLGEGGFGSVYLGKLPDGTRIAVKKLEGIGQGKKEFRSEVSIIGSIHHIHLVKLRGFCAEGSHRLLAYEYMAKGSLDRWIFQKNEQGFVLDWDKRYSIAVGTAKGLAYLHEDCESKIVHCDIKPENVLLDDNFHAKVSDFGLAKLMTREQSHVFTTLRGTRGYLAPEWITNYAISEKSDVYSYGMVLLEIIGGRKNFDPSYSSEKAHFPSYAFKKMEEGKLKEICDSKLAHNDKDERIGVAIKVALWCIQEDLGLRPSMAKVVQMLEGLQEVPQPPVSCQTAFRLYANVFKAISEEGTSSGSGPSDCNSDAFLSAVRLSGPR